MQIQIVASFMEGSCGFRIIMITSKTKIAVSTDKVTIQTKGVTCIGVPSDSERENYLGGLAADRPDPLRTRKSSFVLTIPHGGYSPPPRILSLHRDLRQPDRDDLSTIAPTVLDAACGFTSNLGCHRVASTICLSSFLRSATSSRSRAANSNWSSLAA